MSGCFRGRWRGLAPAARWFRASICWRKRALPQGALLPGVLTQVVGLRLVQLPADQFAMGSLACGGLASRIELFLLRGDQWMPLSPRMVSVARPWVVSRLVGHADPDRVRKRA